EQERGERLRPHCEPKYLVAEDAFGDELANGRERAIGALGLSVVLHRACCKSGGGLAVDETGTRERGTHRLDLVGGELIADHDLHRSSQDFSCRLLESFKTATLLDGFGRRLYVSRAIAEAAMRAG